MSNPITRIHNSETNEIIDREMTASELADYQAGQELQVKKLAAELKLAADKASATAKLEALGLTADDLKALGL